jgi:dihydroorotate dehydrogenase electron transfer subunit
VHRTTAVVEQVRLAHGTYRLRVACPEIATQIVPGQFFMIRAPRRTDPLLGRPFALYDVYEEAGRPAGLDFGYVTVGKLTRLMTGWGPGDAVEIWGPLGNGFPLPTGRRLLFVAGGIGQTPFLAAAREVLGRRSYGDPPRRLVRRPDAVKLLYGVRSADHLAGLDDFRAAGLEVEVATDDGTCGHRGFVTELLARELDGSAPPDEVWCCGPEPMMHAAARLCLARGVRCLLSLESPMACGFGACFSCVVRVKDEEGEGWDYRRACVEGPVLPADRLEF